MSRYINILPPEIIVVVLENLPDSATLLAAILSCHHFYDAVKPYIPSVLSSIIISQIASLHDISNILYKILKSVQPAPHALRDLQDQAKFLTQTLVALEGVAHDCGGDLLVLELPLQQCDMQCASIALKVAKNIVQPKDNVIRDWADMISSYNLTFRVALGKARLQKVSVASTVLQQYQRMIEYAMSDLNDQAKSPIIADYLLQKKSIQNIVLAREKRSIDRCLHICNQALDFTMRSDFQVDKRHTTVISSINELVPEERGDLTIFLDRLRQLSVS